MRTTLCVIPPPNFYALPELQNRDMQLCIAPQVLKYPEYHVFPLSYVILDNGLWELGASIRWQSILDAAEMCWPDEIVLPDAFRQRDETIDLVDKYALLHKRPRYNDRPVSYAAVVQGDNPYELVECYIALSQRPYVDCIHVPKVVESIWPFGGRAGFLAYLEDIHVLSNKPHHLLGIWATVEEIRLARSWIRSVDTALPVHSAIQGKPVALGGNFEKTKRPVDYFDFSYLKMSRTHKALLKANIGAIDAICNRI